MTTMIRDLELEKRLLAEREVSGADRYDEVWEGVYVMSPMPNDEHQMLVGRLTRILDEVVADPGLGQVRPGINVSDRVEEWRTNYRVPDVAVFLKGSRAINHESFWLGGPDLAIEIVSPGDQTRDKLAFYADVATTELLVIERDPWQIEYYRHTGGRMELAATATAENGQTLVCKSVGIDLVLRPGESRPTIEVTHAASGRTWSI